ncbi:Transposase (N-terminal fragment) [Nitrospira defluvii]|uniref:Transposase (N-terminal) n=1 Tax=Nitrospira defluvii TaxID=330214 RepID=D8PBR7_9BACT|nr:Transposase (N-terminal fragment) [Nitrospira defluvii]
MDGRALWAESATSVPFNHARSERAAVRSLRSRRKEDAALQTWIREIAATKRRYGCPRIYVRLRREGWRVNHKKVERIYYPDEGLSLRRRRRKKLAAVPRVALPRPTQPGRCYALDFVHDRLVTGRRYKCLTMTDLCSKEVPVIEVDVSIGGHGCAGFWIGCF